MTDDLAALREASDRAERVGNKTVYLYPDELIALRRLLAAPSPEARLALDVEEHHPSCCGACDECLRICWGYHGPERRSGADRRRAATPSPEPHPPYPLPADFDAMTDAEFWGYVERIGAGDRIRRAMAEEARHE
jgi:hypothetical protein